MKYTVGDIKKQGFDAKWAKTKRGTSIIVARDPESPDETFYAVTRDMWDRAKAVGFKEAFREHTALGEFFSVAI